MAEIYDGVLNDINGFHVQHEHVIAALKGAQPGPVAEGGVGGGTGMICHRFKGGIGTSSRRIKTSGKSVGMGTAPGMGLKHSPLLSARGLDASRPLV